MAEESTPNIEDLEDGEIESDGEEAAEVQSEEKKEEEPVPVVDEKEQETHDTEEPFYSKPGKKKKSKNRKAEKKLKDQIKKNKKLLNNVEEDFAGSIEKAIRKAMNRNDEGHEVGHQEDFEPDERRKNKKRKKYDGKEGSSKKRKKQDYTDVMDESEMMCVRGASPVQRHSPMDNYQEDEKDSYASDSSNESRGQQHQQRPQRHRNNQRDRKNNKNDRDRRRGAHPMQDPDGVCLYFMQGKCHKGDDCMFSHDALPPRKMELCKFYLMECCAKRDKCLYMHADFPCKYYHTGLPCIYKDECKFAHGPPLSDNLKNILLKHIESAPKEILGDFPRLNREGAMKMIQTTQMKLRQQYEPDSQGNIPSLFDLNIQNPSNIPEHMLMNQYNNDKQNKMSPKVRHSRWQNDNSMLNYNPNISPNSNMGNPNVLNIKNLTGVLTPKQITDLSKMGIDNLDQLGQLTVLQLNSIGISVKQITEIQLNTMSIQKLGLINNSEQMPSFVNPAEAAQDLDLRVPPSIAVANTSIVAAELPERDVDMRFQSATTVPNIENTDQINIEPTQSNKDMIDIDQYTKDALKFALKDKENIDNSNETFDVENSGSELIPIENKDVDHRVLPFADDDIRPIRPPLDVHSKKESDTDIRFLQPEPIFKSPEKRNRRSTTDDDDENNLCIDEKWYSSDEEKGGVRKKSPATSPQLMSPPQTPTPHVIEPSAVLKKLGDLSKIDISEEVTKLLNTMKNNLHEPQNEPKTDCSVTIKSRDPRSRPSPEPRTSDILKSTTKKPPRVSIYECIEGEPTDGRRRSDVDLRQPDFKLLGDTDLRQGSSGDIDFRLGLPFKPLPNYTPASEIDGSINSHPPIPYKLATIDIPRPDYTDIKNSTAKSQALVDPRLRKVFRLSIDEYNSDTEKSVKSQPTTSSSPRVDPRRKPKDSDLINQDSKSTSLDLQVVIQNSEWYKDLSSTHKIFVNQQIATVTAMIKMFQQDKTPGKKLDLVPIQSNSVLVSIFNNLGVALGENGEFSYLPKPKEALLKTPAIFNQNQNPFGMPGNAMGVGNTMDSGNMNIMNMQQMGNMNMNMGGPMNNMGMANMSGYNPNYNDPRGGPAPGLLGIAPNMPHNFNKFPGNNNFGNMPYNGPGNDFGNMDGDQNFHRYPNRGGGHRGRGNDRWNRGSGGGGGGGRGHRDRKNFNERGNWKNDRQ